MEQFPEKNPNPVISVGNDGKVLYSNVAGEPLLHEWGVGVGEKLPSSIGDFVQRVISRNSPEKIEVKVGKKVYLVAFHPLPEEECVNIYGFDISDQKELEEKLQESEAWEMANLELADIIDAQAIQSLMDDFYKLVHIPIGSNRSQRQCSGRCRMAGYLHQIPQGSSRSLQALRRKRHKAILGRSPWRV